MCVHPIKPDHKQDRNLDIYFHVFSEQMILGVDCLFIQLSLELSVSGKAFYGIMLWRSRLNTSEAQRVWTESGQIPIYKISSINLQTPIIYPSVVFFSISIVTIISMLRP